MPLIMALTVTIGLLATAATLFATGIFKQLGMLPTIGIIVIDTIAVVVIWILYALGKLGPRQ